MEINVRNAIIKKDNFLVYRIFSHLQSKNKIYYITKDTDIANLNFFEVEAGSAYANYNKEYIALYNLNVLEQDAVLITKILEVRLGSRQTCIVNIFLDSKADLISIKHIPTKVEIFTGNATVNIGERYKDLFEIKVLKQQSFYKKRLIKEDSNE